MLIPEGKRHRELYIALMAVIETFFGERILPFDALAAGSYAGITARERKLGRPLGIMDAQIAAIASVAGASVATRDIAPFTAALVPTTNPWQT